MLATRSHSASQKKGLSVSLSKNKTVSQEKQIIKQNLPLKQPLIQQKWHIYHPVHIKANTQALKRQVVIYRQTKTEWEKLQQSNKNKRGAVESMKHQLEHITKQEKLLTHTLNSYHRSKENYNKQVQKMALKRFDQNFNKQNLGNSKRCDCSTLNKNFEQTQNPYKLDPKRLEIREEQHQNQQKWFKIKITQPTDKSKISNLANKRCLLNVNYENSKNVQLLKLPLQNQNKKCAYGTKKLVTIDVGVLQQIENKLNSLIDFTKF